MTQEDAQHHILTRREIQPYDIDNDPERHAASAYLKSIGLFSPIGQLYHGRVIGDNEADLWRVDPMFQDGGNNYNKVPALSAGSYDLALTFARTRAAQVGSRDIEILRILSDDPAAVIINGDFRMSKLGADEQAKARKALDAFSIPLTAGSPLPFADKEALKDTKLSKVTPRDGYLAQNNISGIASQLGLRPSVAQQVLSSFNTRRLLREDPAKVASSHLRATKSVKKVGYDGPVPINDEYVASWFRSAHIVGVSKQVLSGNLGQTIDPVFLLDLGSIHTEREMTRRRMELAKTYGSIALNMLFAKSDMFGPSHAPKGEVLNLLTTNLYATPRALVEAAKRVPGYKAVFEADAGNWEGYTVGEHTETVLRTFNTNFANKLPFELLPVMNLALLTHDIGKGEAARNNDKKNQGAYNVRESDRFMDAIGIPPRLKQLIIGMTGPAQKLTTEAAVKGDPTSRDRLYKLCSSLLSAYEPSWATPDNAAGLAGMCMAIQTCDSIAYTDYAITRSEPLGVHHRNFPQFNRNAQQHTQFVRQSAGLEWPWDSPR